MLPEQAAEAAGLEQFGSFGKNFIFLFLYNNHSVSYFFMMNCLRDSELKLKWGVNDEVLLDLQEL